MQALQPGMRVAPDGKRLLVQGRSLSQLDDSQVLALAKQFDANFVVLASEPPRKLVTAYRNAKWTVYRPELASPPQVVTTDALGEQQRFLDEVALPNIEKHRRSDVRLQVVDAAGRPLYDARYRITETKSAFGFGGINFTVLTEPAWWFDIEPQDGQRRYDKLEQAFTPGTPTEFSFLAGFPPAWLKAKPEAEQGQRLLKHAEDLVDRYAAKVDYWQLTDQGLYLSQMSNLVVKLRAKHPGLKLGISVAPRLDAFDRRRGLDDVRQLKGLDFVALHGHQPWGVWADPKMLYETFDAFAKEGGRIHITQFSAPSEGWIEGPVRRGQQWSPALQAEYARVFYTVAFSHPAVDVINPVDPALIPRELITQQWQTAVTGTVALDGVVTFRGFHGTYELEVTAPGGQPVRTTFTVAPGANNYRFQLDAAGKLARDTSSPCVDNRPLLVAGKPEVRRYHCRYIQKDQEIGVPSEDVVVTATP
jgi:hypothetical protein